MYIKEKGMMTFAYDGDGNLSSLETKAGDNVLLSFAYQYDGNGNRTAKVGNLVNTILGNITAGSNALDISYQYDVRGQLLEERRNGASVCYAYDKAGNRIRKTDAKGATLYQFNGKNQLIAEESSNEKNQFTYDRHHQKVHGYALREKGKIFIVQEDGVKVPVSVETVMPYQACHRLEIMDDVPNNEK